MQVRNISPINYNSESYSKKSNRAVSASSVTFGLSPAVTNTLKGAVMPTLYTLVACLGMFLSSKDGLKELGAGLIGTSVVAEAVHGNNKKEKIMNTDTASIDTTA